MKTVSFIRKIGVAALAASVATAALAAPAQTPAEPQLTEEQKAIVDHCEFLTSGLVEIAAMRQSEVSKEDAVKNVDAAISEQSKKFTKKEEKDALKELGEFWKSYIDPIYGAPVLTTNDDKRDFVTGVYMQSMQDCVSEFSQAASK